MKTIEKITPKKKISLSGIALFVGLSGCAADPINFALDSLPRELQPGFHRDMKEREMRERGYNRNKMRLPENVIFRDGQYHPVPGYTWVNPNDQNDLRVRPIGK